MSATAILYSFPIFRFEAAALIYSGAFRRIRDFVSKQR
jgi:hypothetical protein